MKLLKWQDHFVMNSILFYLLAAHVQFIFNKDFGMVLGTFIVMLIFYFMYAFLWISETRRKK